MKYKMLAPFIQARVDFLNKLENEVKNAKIGSDLRICLEKFVNYCLNLDIKHSFGTIALKDSQCDESLRKNLLSNIDMAKNVCLGKRDVLPSSSNLTINNTNHQEQVLNLSFQIQENLRKSLTGEQYDEIIDLINKKADKKSIFQKLKEFGLDVVSNTLASIITNGIV